MIERALVPQDGSRQGRHRGVAAGIQREATQEKSWQAGARHLCKTTGHQSGYDDARALKLDATKAWRGIELAPNLPDTDAEELTRSRPHWGFNR